MQIDHPHNQAWNYHFEYFFVGDDYDMLRVVPTLAAPNEQGTRGGLKWGHWFTLAPGFDGSEDYFKLQHACSVCRASVVFTLAWVLEEHLWLLEHSPPVRTHLWTWRCSRPASKPPRRSLCPRRARVQSCRLGPGA